MKNKIVIYTAIAGDYDKLIQHTYKSDNFDYVCFTDQRIENSGMWDIRPLDFNSLDNVRNAKYYKVFPNKLFPDYNYSLWIDGNIDILNNNLEKRIKELVDFEAIISANTHAKSNCAYQEAYVCITESKDNPEIILKEIESYLYIQKYHLVKFYLRSF